MLVGKRIYIYIERERVTSRKYGVYIYIYVNFMIFKNNYDIKQK